jgi:YVTN family beta-propeller protein
MLFTDIEGSTLLVRELGERYEEVLATHRHLLRSAAGEGGGKEIDTQGDAFFFAFPRARDAVLSAAAAQRALADTEWPDGHPVRVRMGIHTGEPGLGEEGYHGLGVVRAARICAAGHGGQVLLSQATRSLIEDGQLRDLTVRDLGEHQLKDLPLPERIFQLVGPGLADDFPPLRTTETGTPLPVAGTEEQLAEAARAAVTPVERPRLSRRPGVLIVGGGVLLTGAVIGALVFTHDSGSGGLGHIEPNSVGVIDAKSNQIVAQVPVGTRPSRLVYGSGSLWAVNEGDNTLSRIDPVTRRQIRVTPLDAAPTGLAAANKSVWVTTHNGIKVIDPAFDEQPKRTIKIREPRPTVGGPYVPAPTGVAFTPGAAWVVNGDFGGHVLRRDSRTGQIDELTSGNSPAAIASGSGGVWVTDVFDNAVTHIDQTGAVDAPIRVGRGPVSLAVDDNAVWVADSADDNVIRIDPRTQTVVKTIDVGHSPTAITVGGGSVWVANRVDGTISRIDPRSNKVVHVIKIGGSPVGLAFARGSLWVSVQSAPLSSTTLGKDVVQIDSNPIPIDPSISSLGELNQLEYATCAKLLNYPDKPGPAGWRLQPEVAASMPAVSPDGKTYTFTIRGGYKFSPPSNELVTAETFKYTIERTLNPKLQSGIVAFVGDIVGEQAYLKQKAQHISGVVARGKTLTIRLAHPAGDLPARMALPPFCAVPTNAPMHLTETPIPSAGPYYIASHVPGAQTVLKRNPNYTGPRTRRLAEIVYTTSFPSTLSVARALAGQTDYALEAGGSASWTTLNRRLGPHSPAARAGHQQVFINQLPDGTVTALTLNSSRPLFADARLRRAVNYAIDRRALARLGEFNPVTGALTATPTDQYLPPGMAGYRERAIYPLSGDLRKAKQLAGERRRVAVMYTCDFAPCLQEAQVVKRNLAAIGISVEVRSFAINDMFARQAKRNEPYDIGLSTWRVDYPDPFDVLNLLLDGNLRVNDAHFDDPVWNRRLEAAAKLSGDARYRAYARLDADLAGKAAPWVAFENENVLSLFSARIGCQLYQPVYGIDLAALCVRD